jgi:long-chain acyl-CoA synthetase
VKNIRYSSDEEMIRNPEVLKRYKRVVDESNKLFGNYEQIKKFQLMEQEWTIQTRELTANLKLRRNYICDKYKEQIQQLFN